MHREKTTQKVLTCFFISVTSAIASVIPGSSVLCERGFSMQNHVKTKQRSRVMDVHVHNVMLIAMKGPMLEGTETSAVIHWACTELCSRRKRQ